MITFKLDNLFYYLYDQIGHMIILIKIT